MQTHHCTSLRSCVKNSPVNCCLALHKLAPPVISGPVRLFCIFRRYLGWMLILVALVGCHGASAWASPGLEIHFLDIGQGDAILIRSPSGKVAVIDAGPPSASRTLTRYLQRLKISRINLFLVTHPHYDHFGGWKGLLRPFSVAMYMDPGFPHSSPSYKTFLRALQQRQIKTYTAQLNQLLDLGGQVVLRVLGPERPFLRNTRSDANANSVVVRLEYKRLRVLLTGDAERPTENRLLQRPSWLPSHILKVAHHGSGHSSSQRFLRHVRPQFAIISCAEDNSYGHPHPKTMRRLKQAGIETFVTARHGTIIARSDGQKLWISTQGRSQAQAVRQITLSPLSKTPLPSSPHRHSSPPHSSQQDSSDDQ